MQESFTMTIGCAKASGYVDLQSQHGGEMLKMRTTTDDQRFLTVSHDRVSSAVNHLGCDDSIDIGLVYVVFMEFSRQSEF
jgi:hypothetical protein